MTTNWTLYEPDMTHDSVYYLAFRYHNSNKGYGDALSRWLILWTQNFCQRVLKMFDYFSLIQYMVNQRTGCCPMLTRRLILHSLAVVLNDSYQNIASLFVNEFESEM